MAFGHYLRLRHSRYDYELCADNNPSRMRFTRPDMLFPIACRYGHLALIQMLESTNVLNGFREACRYGQIDVVRYLMSKYKGLSCGIYSAIREGHMDIVELILQNGDVDKNTCFIEACASGDMRLVNMFMTDHIPSLNMGLLGACRAGNVNLALDLISRGAGDLDEALNIACAGGKLSPLNKSQSYSYEVLALNLLNIGARIDPNRTFYSVCRGGNEYLLNKICSMSEVNINQGLAGACAGGHLWLVEDLISRGARHIAHGFHLACCNGHVECAKYLISLGADPSREKLFLVCFRGYMPIVELLTSRNYDEGLRGACMGGHIDIVKYMISRGAKNIKEALSIMDNYWNEEIYDYLSLFFTAKKLTC